MATAFHALNHSSASTKASGGWKLDVHIGPVQPRRSGRSFSPLHAGQVPTPLFDINLFINSFTLSFFSSPKLWGLTSHWARLYESVTAFTARNAPPKLGVWEGT